MADSVSVRPIKNGFLLCEQDGEGGYSETYHPVKPTISVNAPKQQSKPNSLAKAVKMMSQP